MNIFPFFIIFVGSYVLPFLLSFGLQIVFLTQLSSVTEERDRLKNVVDELKKHNTETGAEIAGGTLLQVVEHHSFSM